MEHAKVDQLVKNYEVSRATIYRWISCVRANKEGEYITKHSVTKKVYNVDLKRKTYFTKIRTQTIEYLKKYLKNRTMINVRNIKRNIKRNVGVTLSFGSIYNIIKDKLNLSHKRVKKKKVLYKNLASHKLKVKGFKQKVNDIGLDNTYSTDESHFYLGMTDAYGWSKKGEYCAHKLSSIKYKKFSLIMTVSNSRVINYKLYEKSVNGTKFFDYITSFQVPDNVHVILDNCSVHKTNIFKEYVNQTKLNVLYNVPYSPETNPIEMVFSQIKSFVKKRTNNTEKQLRNNINRAIKRVNKDNLKNYFNKSFLD
jgi:transposase